VDKFQKYKDSTTVNYKVDLRWFKVRPSTYLVRSARLFRILGILIDCILLKDSHSVACDVHYCMCTTILRQMWDSYSTRGVRLWAFGVSCKKQTGRQGTKLLQLQSIRLSAEYHTQLLDKTSIW
jgi:hypothetical protein